MELEPVAASDAAVGVTEAYVVELYNVLPI